MRGGALYYMPTFLPDHFPQAINYSLQQIPYAPHELNGVLGAFSSIANRTQNLQVLASAGESLSFTPTAVGDGVDVIDVIFFAQIHGGDQVRARHSQGVVRGFRIRAS